MGRHAHTATIRETEGICITLRYREKTQEGKDIGVHNSANKKKEKLI